MALARLALAIGSDGAVNSNALTLASVLIGPGEIGRDQRSIGGLLFYIYIYIKNIFYRG